MTALTTHPGNFVTERSASRLEFFLMSLEICLKYFFLQRPNTKAAKKFRVETPFLLCTAEAFKTQLILYVIK